MKLRIVSLFSAFALCLALASCTSAPAHKDVDMSGFFDTVSSSHEMQMGLQPPEEEFIANFYPGLSDITTKQRHLYLSLMTMATQEFAFIEAENEDDAKAVADILQARIDKQVEGGAWYPSAIEAWQNDSRVVTHGNYVAMIVHPDADAIVEEFYALFK